MEQLKARHMRIIHIIGNCMEYSVKALIAGYFIFAFWLVSGAIYEFSNKHFGEFVAIMSVSVSFLIPWVIYVRFNNKVEKEKENILNEYYNAVSNLEGQLGLEKSKIALLDLLNKLKK